MEENVQWDGPPPKRTGRQLRKVTLKLEPEFARALAQFVLQERQRRGLKRLSQATVLKTHALHENPELRRLYRHEQGKPQTPSGDEFTHS